MPTEEWISGVNWFFDLGMTIVPLFYRYHTRKEGQSEGSILKHPIFTSNKPILPARTQHRFQQECNGKLKIPITEKVQRSIKRVCSCLDIREMIQVAETLGPVILKLNDRNQVKSIIETFEASDKKIVATVPACDKLGVPVPDGLKLIMSRARIEPGSDDQSGEETFDEEKLEADYQKAVKAAAE